MSERAHIVEALKKTLKSRGVTYRELARRVQLSEASIKRLFAEQTFTLARMEQICSALNMSIAELVRLASQELDEHQVTFDQEELLASDVRLLACFYLLQNGRNSSEIATELRLGERELRRVLVRLNDAKLIELQPKLKARLRVPRVIAWRTDGPVRRLYEQQVKTEFLHSQFTGGNEQLIFRSAELSAASASILRRKLEVLARDFGELAALDAGLPDNQKRSIGVLMAMRPWIFSLYESLRSR